jgi:hypothetical protein
MTPHFWSWGNGTRIDVLVSSSPLRCANEGDTAAVLIMNDMAEVRRARVELQSAEKRYKLPEEHVSDFITGRDPELKYDDIDKVSRTCQRSDLGHPLQPVHVRDVYVPYVPEVP